MWDRVKILGSCLGLILVIMYLMVVTFNYLRSSYYAENNPPSLISNTRCLSNHQEQQIQELQKPSFFSYMPPWPVLILGSLGLIITRVINYTVDLVMGWIFKKEN